MLVGIGDLHLNYLEKFIPGSHKLVLSSFDKVVDKAAEKGASAIVQLGDVCDDAYPEQEHIVNLLISFRKHPKIPKYVIMGNHDHADVTNHALRTLGFLCNTGFINGKVFLKPKVVEIDDERYLFSPHPYIIDTPPKNVRFCFGHFGFEGARGDNGFVIKNGNAPKGRWILGDYHTAQRGKSYMYPGSLCQVKWHESPDKYYIELDDKPRLIKHIPDLRLGRATITSTEDLEALDPKVFWSVNIERKAKLPADWASKYPWIVRHHAEKQVSKRAQVLMEQVASEDPLEGLSDYLRNEGMDDRDVKRAYTLLGRKAA